jgi:hypothetical protein
LVLAALSRLYSWDGGGGGGVGVAMPTVSMPTVSRTPSAEIVRTKKLSDRASDIAQLAVNLSAALYIDATRSRLLQGSTTSGHSASSSTTNGAAADADADAVRHCLRLCVGAIVNLERDTSTFSSILQVLVATGTVLATHAHLEMAVEALMAEQLKEALQRVLSRECDSVIIGCTEDLQAALVVLDAATQQPAAPPLTPAVSTSLTPQHYRNTATTPLGQTDGTGGGPSFSLQPR